MYILDRQMTSLMGLPQSIQDGDVHCRLPVYQGSPQRTTSLDLHIKLARLIAEVNNSKISYPVTIQLFFFNLLPAFLSLLSCFDPADGLTVLPPFSCIRSKWQTQQKFLT